MRTWLEPSDASNTASLASVVLARAVRGLAAAVRDRGGADAIAGAADAADRGGAAAGRHRSRAAGARKLAWKSLNACHE